MDSTAAILNPYQDGASILHRMDARVKLPLALIFILAVSLTPASAWPALAVLLGVVLAAALLSGLGIAYVWQRALLALPFILAAAPLLFTAPGPFLVLGGGDGLRLLISLPGLERFLGIAARSWLSLQAAVILTATTPFSQLLLALRFLGVPRLFVAVVGLMWRFLFLMVDEVARMLRARAARSGAPAVSSRREGGSLDWRARVTGGMAGSLLLRSLERSDRVYAAMLARGYDGEPRTPSYPPMDKKQWLSLFGGASLLLLVMVLGLLSGA